MRSRARRYDNAAPIAGVLFAIDCGLIAYFVATDRLLFAWISGACVVIALVLMALNERREWVVVPVELTEAGELAAAPDKIEIIGYQLDRESGERIPIKRQETAGILPYSGEARPKIRMRRLAKQRKERA